MSAPEIAPHIAKHLADEFAQLDFIYGHVLQEGR